ncbi:MAG: hypothetical protein GY838_19220 [bacterium]|nr:hypothetical protein [bacterium]
MLQRTPTRFRTTARACLALLVLLLAAGTAAGRDADRATASQPSASYLRIAQAWEDGNPEVLADLIHPDGLQVRIGKGGRATSYSPSQAFYFFKNLFRDNLTESFDYQRQQKATGPRVHAMAVWRCREAPGDPLHIRRLVLVLARSGDTWQLTEINTVR